MSCLYWPIRQFFFVYIFSYLQAAITKLDQQVCEAVKKLNALRHQKNTRQKKLEALQTEYNQLVTDAEEVSNTDVGESAEAQVKNLRVN